MSKIDEIVSAVFFVLFLSLFTFLGSTVGHGIDLLLSSSAQIVRGFAMGTVPMAWIGFYMFWAWLGRERARLA
jgi:hypothetical protein